MKINIRKAEFTGSIELYCELLSRNRENLSMRIAVDSVIFASRVTEEKKKEEGGGGGEEKKLKKEREKKKKTL